MEVNDATAASDTAMPETPDTAPEIATESDTGASTPEGAVDAAFAKLDAEEQSEAFSETPAEVEQVEGEAPEGEQH